MIPKQTEMDGIVKKIYAALETEDHLQSTLLVLCGDHGMNDAGNHGGSAESETSPALVFVSPKLRAFSKGNECPVALPDGNFQYYSTVEQSDIAPTLAGMLGFPVPLNNLGVFIPEMLGLWAVGEYQELPINCRALADKEAEDRVRVIKQNAEQILGVVKETFTHYAFDGRLVHADCTTTESDGELLECLWSRATVALAAERHSAKSEAVPALMEVRISSKRWHSEADKRVVLKTCPGYHEQHGK